MYNDLTLHSWTPISIFEDKCPWRAFAEAAAGGGQPAEWTLPENDPRTHIPPADAAGSLWREGEAPQETVQDVWTLVASIFSGEFLYDVPCEVIGAYASCSGRSIFLLRSGRSHYVLVARWESKPRLGASEENLNAYLGGNAAVLIEDKHILIKSAARLLDERNSAYKITTAQLCGFFLSRAVNFTGELKENEFPAADCSFAPVPVRVEGDIVVVAREQDPEYENNTYEIFKIPSDSAGCVVERESVHRLWRFEGVGDDQWAVVAPKEVWRVKNVFEGAREGSACSDDGPNTPEGEKYVPA